MQINILYSILLVIAQYRTIDYNKSIPQIITSPWTSATNTSETEKKTIAWEVKGKMLNTALPGRDRKRLWFGGCGRQRFEEEHVGKAGFGGAA